MAAVESCSPRRRFWSRCKSSIGAPPKYSGGTYWGLPTSYRAPGLHTMPPPYAALPYAAPPYAAPPYAAPPLRPLPTPSPSQARSPAQSLASNPSVEEEELMQLAVAMSVSEAAAQGQEAPAVPSPRELAPPLRRHSQPAGEHASHQQHHPRRAETLSDEALARALSDMYDEEFAREQQLGEMRGAGQRMPMSVQTPAQMRAPIHAHLPRAQQAGAGQLQPSAPRPEPPQHISPLQPAARPGEAVMHDNPLGGVHGTVANPLRAPRTAAAVGVDAQRSIAPSPEGQSNGNLSPAAPNASSRLDLLLSTAPAASSHHMPGRPADDLPAQQQRPQQLPDLIRLDSPEPQPLMQPVSTAAGVTPGMGVRLAPPAAAQMPGHAAASWPLPANSCTHPPAAAASSHCRAGSSHAGGATQLSGPAAAHIAAAAVVPGPLEQGVAALPPQPPSAANLRAQLRAQHGQQQAWWLQHQAWQEQQRQQEAERRQRRRRQQQQQHEQQVHVTPEVVAATASMHQKPAADAQPSRTDHRQPETQLPAAQPLPASADGQQHARGTSAAGPANCGGRPAAAASAGGTGSAAGSGALWSAFFEFPEDSDLTDCHPALLQAARLQQEAAATIAAAAAEGPTGRISPGQWRAMHLDIAEAYTCPITQEVTEDPVMAADSFTYERSAMAAWLHNHDTSPMTNAQLPHKELIPNVAARSAIRTLREAGLLDGAAGD